MSFKKMRHAQIDLQPEAQAMPRFKVVVYTHKYGLILLVIPSERCFLHIVLYPDSGSTT